MKGSIRPPSGKRKSWTAIIYTGRDENGKKQHKWLSAKSEKELERKVNETIYQVNHGTYAAPKGTLSEFLDRWLKDYAKNLSPRTYEGYQSIIRSGVGPVLGKVLLKDLKPDRIQKYYTQKQEAGAKPTTVRHHHMMLHRALEHAVKLQLLTRNPTDAVTPPPIQHVEMHTLDEEGLGSVLEAAQNTSYFTLFHCSLYTGMRRSEVLALRWQDVDFINGEISVSRSLHQLYSKKIIIRGTKTARSARLISLDKDTREVLARHYEKESALCARLGATLSSDRLVFCTWDGKPMLPGTITQAWRKLMHRLGHDGVRLHDARHTHASLLLKAGIHPKVVQERLGHASINTTLDLYSHVAPGMQRQAAEAFGELVSKRASKRASTEAEVREPEYVVVRK